MNALPSIERMPATETVVVSSTGTGDSSAQQKRQQLCGSLGHDVSSTGNAVEQENDPRLDLSATISPPKMGKIGEICHSTTPIDLNATDVLDNVLQSRAISSIG